MGGILWGNLGVVGLIWVTWGLYGVTMPNTMPLSMSLDMGGIGAGVLGPP